MPWLLCSTTLLSAYLGSQAELAQAVVDNGAVPQLILCLQEPEISLKRIAASSISDIAKHSPELAQTVVDAGAVAYLSQQVDATDAKLKRQVFSALSQVRAVLLNHQFF